MKKLRPKSALVTSNMINTALRPRSALAKDFQFEESKEAPKFNDVNINKPLDRMWIFEKYVDENIKMLFFEAAEELRHINFSVQQDIEDNIITEGMNISREALEHRDKFRGLLKEKYR